MYLIIKGKILLKFFSDEFDLIFCFGDVHKYPNFLLDSLPQKFETKISLCIGLSHSLSPLASLKIRMSILRGFLIFDKF